MTETMAKAETHANPESAAEAKIRPLSEDEQAIDMSDRKNNLGQLVHYGRVRLHAEDGSVVEISDPRREAWRDPEASFHVKLDAWLSDELKERHGLIPDGARTRIYDGSVIEVASELHDWMLFKCSGRISYGLGPSFSDFVLRDICKVELVVSGDSRDTIRGLIGRMAMETDRLSEGK
jgi:hypothetical protein